MAQVLMQGLELIKQVKALVSMPWASVMVEALAMETDQDKARLTPADPAKKR